VYQLLGGKCRDTVASCAVLFMMPTLEETLAGAAGMRIYPGNHPGTSVCVLSAAHLAAAWSGPVLDGPFTVGTVTLADDVVTEPVRLEGCAVRVPDVPGLGVILDEEKIRRFRVEA
jgi:muconate cycloisomerase